MKINFRHIPAALLLATATLPAAAQEFRSSYFMQTSNFRHQMNPALLDSSYVAVFLGNLNVGTTGNIGLKNFVYKTDPAVWGYELGTFMHPSVSAGEFLGGLHDKNRADVYLNMNLVSVAFKALGGSNLVELNLRSNTNVSLPKELFEFMKTTGSKEHYSLENIGMRTQNYLELALGHSHSINEKLTVGAKMKLLFGAAYADLDVNRLDVTMNGDQWRIQGDARLKAAILKSELTHEGPDKNSEDGRSRVDGLDDVSFSLPGFGLGFDLGATYKVMDGLTVSAALTDLGFISWSGVKQASSAGDYTFDGFEDIHVSGDNKENKLGDQFEQLGDDLGDMFALYDDGEGSHTQALAATLNLGAEYELPYYKKLRFGFLYTSRLSGLYSWHQGMLSANVRPVKWFEATLNTAVSSTGWTLGAAASFKARHFNFYVGTDRFFGKVSKEFIPLNNLNANVNFGMTFPL
ncbi:DUF5723 family protein [uncultured Bacteroides sp.]|uniref:DUF5723 family protein n=1 Tax=uncultured Bacteroides sp. TaxID=162156 RepID=UPI00259B06BF|nr:DUF5723 family protein [uncultured Bacteroides sp.]